MMSVETVARRQLVTLVEPVIETAEKVGRVKAARDDACFDRGAR